MASPIDPSKPADGAPASKADLRANLQTVKSAIEALQSGASHIVARETRTSSHTYAAADFDAAPDGRPLYVLVNAAAAPVILTFPDPEDFGLTNTQARVIAQVRSLNNSNDVTIACARPDAMRSQPGTAGWNANASPVKIGASLASADEATVTITLEGPRLTANDSVMIVDGAVRA